MARRRPMSLPRRIGLLLERTTTEKGRAMTKILAGITTSVDGFIAGPDDGPGQGLGAGGERLHYWVFGGPWSYRDQSTGSSSQETLELLERLMARTGAIVVGRWMYEAGEHWGEKNPREVPVFVVTHRLEEEP